MRFLYRKRRSAKKLCRICLCALLALCGCFGGFCGCGGEYPKANENAGEVWENPGVRVTFFDVGKGDAILIETAKHGVLIDSGYEDTSEIILNYLDSQGIDRLDYLILTHFDKDHVGGADRILEAVDVGEVFQPDYESDGKQYWEYEEVMEKKELRPVLVTEMVRMSLDGANFLIYPPQQQWYEEEDNDFSLVISMRYGGKSFFFAGDCERERLDELLNQNEFNLAHDVLKVPHHGRGEENSEEFLKAVAPKIAVITCSEEKPADEEVCRILEGIGADIYFSADGTVTCLCDGKKLEMVAAH